ncbi:MAG: DUF3147 family protein [Euryarchaeota archaeon]|jgi:hypothetical protein|nr:DUF3147 family protein [Euryarchaeota archaeon]MBT4981533.1 DUF3147 family protein [Euryarchaeota archaeon]MBT5184481.1 DUF3147 family protein [Euryarchaeota archaeon]
MTWLSWLAKGLFSGAIVVAASEIAKKSTIYGAILISIPFMSIMSLILLYNDTKDVEKVADYAEGILWLVIPSLLLFLIIPILLRRNWSFEAAMALGLIVTITAYLISTYLAINYGQTTN